MSVSVMVVDEASAKRVCGRRARVEAVESLGMIRVTVNQSEPDRTGVMACPYHGHIEMPLAMWREVVSEIQGLFAKMADVPPEDRGEWPWDGGSGVNKACCDRGRNCDCGVPIVGECGWGNDERIPPCGKATCAECAKRGTVTLSPADDGG